MQPSPIVIVFVSKKTYTLLAGLGSTLFCSVQRSVLFFFIMYVEQALDLRILVTRTYINTHTYSHNDSYSRWQHLARSRIANHGHFEKNILCCCTCCCT